MNFGTKGYRVKENLLQKQKDKVLIEFLFEDFRVGANIKKYMVKIRLKRIGSKNRPAYRIVVADSRNPRDGAVIEEIGWYNPMLPNEDNFAIRLDRVDEWLKKGAHPTETVANLIRKARKRLQKIGTT